MSTDLTPNNASEAVELTQAAEVAWLWLNRPDVLNAIDNETIDCLHRHLDVLERSPVRVVVLTGRGRAFCAGADLKAAARPDGSVDAAGVTAFVHRISDVVRRLAGLQKPVIAAVNGLALAGGLELVLACDLVVAAEDALIGDAHANFGLLPGAGGAVRLPRVVGPTVAKGLMYTGKSLPARDFVQYGLVTEAVPAADLITHVEALAAELCRRSPVALSAMKRLIDDGLSQSVDTALRLEKHAIDAHSTTDDFAEGLAAFREKRPPSFSAPTRPVTAATQATTSCTALKG